jgi:hypothetical protein
MTDGTRLLKVLSENIFRTPDRFGFFLTVFAALIF